MKKILFYLLTVSALSSCTVLFTHSTRMTIENQGNEAIEKVQFYTDRPILLEYKSKTQDENISGGKVEIREGYYYYLIEIPAKTQGVASYLNETQLKLKFEEGSNRLIFGWHKSSGEYVLNGKSVGKGFQVAYEGKDFLVKEGSNTRLLIKKNSDVKSETEKRRVSGVQVN